MSPPVTRRVAASLPWPCAGTRDAGLAGAGGSPWTVIGTPVAHTAPAGSPSDPAPRSARDATTDPARARARTPAGSRTSSGCGASDAAPSRTASGRHAGSGNLHVPAAGPARHRGTAPAVLVYADSRDHIRLDDLIRPREYDGGITSPSAFAVLRLITSLELGGLVDGEVGARAFTPPAPAGRHRAATLPARP
jgi:hypothetical protein